MVVLSASSVLAQGGYDPTVQTEALLLNEARTVYLGNLARRSNGVPPLRWNRQLTHAARWYSWDSTENRPAGFCGHQDTNGNWPDYRARAFGYLGGAGAENAFCGYVTPESAIQGWMDSPGHRANLLDPNSREIGLGYYRRPGDGRGYVTQDFGHDTVYAPVIIENEAISTTATNVNLYIYDRQRSGGFAGLNAATHMMVGNDMCFGGAAWETFTVNKSWTLNSGQGWRSVYVKTRDLFGRTLTVSDTIYLGANVPLNELGVAQLSTTQPHVTLYSLNGNGLPQVQFSLGWLADDTFETFNKWWGNGERVSDAAAWGGTAYRLYPGGGESFAWVWDTTFMKDTPMVAYFRLKVNNNTSNHEVARISVKGGGTEYGPLSLRGIDFSAPSQYQEFPLSFTFHSNPNDPFLIFQFWRSASADLYIDAVSIFSAPQPVTSSVTWSAPGGNYRGQGVWVRYTNGSQFSAITEGTTIQPVLQVFPTTLTFLAVRGGTPPPTSTLNVTSDCASLSWQANSNAPWLQTHLSGGTVRVGVNPAGLNNGLYSGTVTISAIGISGVPPVHAHVRLIVTDELSGAYLPFAQRK
ncbi:MAG: CAP domain-containing protein [Anaerolineae bacterium]|nr:CAP domain-containing protein [Thermoflexales bacterium]MDW8406645.1 CAP domain-containing protein [Anaerolineae bacterium]